jgi:L,D-transpeptidase ErfK/SrfK
MRALIIFIFLFIFGSSVIYADEKPKTNKAKTSEYYGMGLCTKKGYQCIKVKGGESWEKLFPDERERDLVQRINRTDRYLWAGKTLVVPENIKKTTIFDVAPFPRKIKAPHEKIIIVDQERLAWSAYNPDGSLEKWGPLSSGKDFCPDIKRSCRTITGIFYVFVKKGKGCKSNIFPVGEGGSNMPYCMFFYKGYALHGSNEVMGYRDSHGCVRLFTRDAEWLNKKWVDAATKEGALGTKVVIQKLNVKK